MKNTKIALFLPGLIAINYSAHPQCESWKDLPAKWKLSIEDHPHQTPEPLEYLPHDRRTAGTVDAVPVAPASGQEAAGCTTKDGQRGLNLEFGCSALGSTELEIDADDLPTIAAFGELRKITIIVGSDDPVDLTPLTSLQDLEYFYAALTKTRDLSPLAGLTKLRALSIGVTGADLAPLGDLKNLDFLSTGSGESLDLAPLSGLPNLSQLMVVGDGPVDLTPLHDLPKLRHLNIDRLTETGSLHGMPRLTSVTVGSGRISDFSALCNLPALRSLALRRIDTHGIATLGGCNRLEKLRLTNSGAREISWISSFGKLRELSLDGTLARSLDPLRGLPHLQRLSLKGVAADLTPLLDMPALAMLILPDGEVVEGAGNIAGRLTR